MFIQVQERNYLEVVDVHQEWTQIQIGIYKVIFLTPWNLRE